MTSGSRKKSASGPTSPNARQLFEQGFALHRQGRAAEALSRYQAALAQHPRHAQALHFSALLLHGAGRSSEALDRIERALAIEDGNADAWSNAGLILDAVGRPGDAAKALERAVALEPSLGGAWSNLASIRLALDDAAGAEVAARRSLAVGASSGGWFNLALALAALVRWGEVVQTLDERVRRHPEDAGDLAAVGLRAQALVALGRPDDAAALLDLVLARIDDPLLRLERARLAEVRGDEARALADFAAVLEHAACDEATHEMALSETVFLAKHAAVWDGLPTWQAAFRRAVARHAASGTPGALTPFTFLSDPSTRAEQLAAGVAWSARYRTAPPHRRPLSTTRLRIGYLSADLHDHATGILAVGLFERHDRSRFEVFAYSTGPDDGSALRRRLVAAFDRFVDVRGWDDARIARAIDADGIDILVDLKGHTEHAPTGVMARRPAPIAVSWLGYPGTTGASFVDYLIGDAIVTPLSDAADYSETIVQLPGCYQVNDDRRVVGPSVGRAAFGLPDDAVVLCSFNATYKFNPDVFDAWARILSRAANAVLWLQVRGDRTRTRERLRRELATRGVAADRVFFADRMPHANYLAAYRCADIVLDTWPYNAHTTAADALWAGCPVLTLRGETFAGRVAESIVRAVGLDDCVAVDQDHYIEAAIRWAADRPALAELRRRVVQGVRTAPLFDTGRTTRALEAAFVAMAAQHRAGRREAIVIAPA